jgi:mannose-6-phosphate isomerase-like protein (cupin superfamily)
MKRLRKPWGHELWFADNKHYAGKIIVIKKGHRLSLQYHKVKHETIYVLEGILKLTLGRRTRLVKPGKAVEIKPRTIHRFTAPKGRVTLAEVSSPHLSDIVRLADDYGRS